MKIPTYIAKFNKTTISLFMVFCLVLSLVPVRPAYAESNQLFVNPASSQMTVNTIFSVNVRSYADSGDDTGTASGTVTYPAHLLQVTSISIAGSGYNLPPPAQRSGEIDFNASRSPAPSGSAQIFSITFKAIGGGSAVVGFKQGSNVNSDATVYKSGVFTVTNPNPSAPKPKPSTTPKPSTVPVVTTPTPTPAEGPVVTPDPTGLIDSPTVSPLYGSATVTWKVNADNANTTMVYGLNTSKLDKKATVTKKSDGAFEAKINSLSPGVRYIFVISATGSGGKAANYTSTIFTRGYPVTVTVTENNVPVKSGQIRIGTLSSPINSNGKATIGLAPGSYSGTVTTDTATQTINLTVEAKNIPLDGSAPEAQTFAYNLTSSLVEQGPGSGTSLLVFIAVLGGGALLLGVGFFVFIAYRRRGFESESDSGVGYANTSPTVVIQDGYTWRDEPQARGTGSMPPVSEPPAQTMPVRHQNSVYIAEEEPLDMFEQAAQKLPPLSGGSASLPDPGVTEQNPSSLHSTKL